MKRKLFTEFVFIFSAVLFSLFFIILNCSRYGFLTEDQWNEEFNSIKETKPDSLDLLYVGEFISGLDGKVQGYVIDNTTGLLTAVPGSPLAMGNTPRSIEFSHNGRFMYANETSPFRNIKLAEIGTDGAISPITEYVMDTVTFDITIDPLERFCYVGISYMGNFIHGFNISAGSGLTAMSGSPFSAGCYPGHAAVSKNGKFLYTTDGWDEQIDLYSVNSVTGYLTAAGSQTVPNYGFLDLKTSNDGALLYAVYSNFTYENMDVFLIDQATGALTRAAGSPYQLGFGPGNLAAGGMTLDKTGKYLYVSSSSEDMIYRYNVNQTTGTLTIVDNFGTSNNPSMMTVSPSGKYMYIYTDNSIGQYQLDIYNIQSDGSLTTTGLSPFAVGCSCAVTAVRRIF